MGSVGSVTKWLPTPLIEHGTDRGQVSAWTSTVEGFELIPLKSSLFTLYNSQSLLAADFEKYVFLTSKLLWALWSATATAAS